MQWASRAPGKASLFNLTWLDMNELIRDIDWDLLRVQKTWLLCRASEGSENAAGLVNLLDSLQDLAVREGVDPLEVFGTLG